MKKQLICIFWLVLLIFQVDISMAQDIVGESDLFTFNTMAIPVPLSNLALLIAGFLAVAFLFVRLQLRRKKTTV